MNRPPKALQPPRLIQLSVHVWGKLHLLRQGMRASQIRMTKHLPRIPLTKGRVLALCTGLGVFSSGALLVYLRYAPLPAGDIVDPSRLVAANGQTIGDLVGAGVTRQEVSLHQIPMYLQEATIAVEDSAFYSHTGINLKGIVRALFANAGAGHIVQGGSTITQQLAKNLFLTGDRTLWRKVREAVYALQLELHYSKKKILTDYLNVIYYGDGATGVGTASEYYFGKPVSQLDLAQCAMLAGLPKGPSLYSPYNNFGSAKERQRAVLQAMVRAGYLTQPTAHAAFLEPLHLAHHSAPDSIAPYFADAVSRMAMDQYHLTKDDLYRGGLYIHTTLDPTLQSALNRAIARYIPKASGLQVAAVAMDVHTGDILAYAGGKNYRQSSYDRANAFRQPGSTFKPFVYAAALDNGWTASAHMKSEPKTFVYDGTRHYLVHNFADEYSYGEIDMKQAIAHSDNVFAVSANMQVGPEQVLGTALAFGLPDDMKPFPSLALGVFPVTPLSMARAYAVFANGGYLAQPRSVSRIDDADGHMLYNIHPARLLVESPSTSYILTDMMKSVMKPGGTGYRIAHLIPGVVAAKTGTTDTDGWIVGYTPSTVCAVWVGYDRMRPINGVESHLAAPIFAAVMRQAFLEHPQGDFVKPDNIVTAAIDPQTGELATKSCPSSEVNDYVMGSEPTSTCWKHPAPTDTLADRALNTLRSIWSWIRGH